MNNAPPHAGEGPAAFVGYPKRASIVGWRSSPSVSLRRVRHSRACALCAPPNMQSKSSVVNRLKSIATTVPAQCRDTDAKSGQARHDKAVCETWRYISYPYFAADTGGIRLKRPSSSSSYSTDLLPVRSKTTRPEVSCTRRVVRWSRRMPVLMFNALYLL
ncbi:hypothetical protein KCP76_08365 [Salmonella enterica subsp. enterica serovar Weltevreden]|nr:hypothetical protein KCP76_08365 [Salmonella enterica subsp. enterica serovar Weltevreden]